MIYFICTISPLDTFGWTSLFVRDFPEDVAKLFSGSSNDQVKDEGASKDEVPPMSPAQLAELDSLIKGPNHSTAIDQKEDKEAIQLHNHTNKAVAPQNVTESNASTNAGVSEGVAAGENQSQPTIVGRPDPVTEAIEHKPGDKDTVSNQSPGVINPVKSPEKSTASYQHMSDVVLSAMEHKEAVQADQAGATDKTSTVNKSPSSELIANSVIVASPSTDKVTEKATNSVVVGTRVDPSKDNNVSTAKAALVMPSSDSRDAAADKVAVKASLKRSAPIPFPIGSTAVISQLIDETPEVKERVNSLQLILLYQLFGVQQCAQKNAQPSQTLSKKGLRAQNIEALALIRSGRELGTELSAAEAIGDAFCKCANWEVVAEVSKV